MPGKFREMPNMGSNRLDCSSKERLKWTQELHDLFEKAASQLGGPERATPKGILKVMGIPALTIFHVKSHLQKYRMSKLLSQMHMNAQRRLSDHLEVQRNLKMKLEAQGRFLDRIVEEQKARVSGSRPSCKSTYSFSPLSLPSLCEESESNIKELESDSEVDKNEIRSGPGFQSRKRTRIDENALNHRYNSNNVAYSSLNSGVQNHPYNSPHEFLWSTLANYQQSPHLPSLYDSIIE